MRGGCSFCFYWWNCWPSLSFLCSLIWGERYLYFYVDTGGLIDHHCLFFVHVPSQDLDFQCQRSWSFIAFIILRSEVFVPCFYWWKITNGLPLLFSFHNTYKWWYILWIYLIKTQHLGSVTGSARQRTVANLFYKNKKNHMKFISDITGCCIHTEHLYKYMYRYMYIFTTKI
jgi:hypothetical protein